MPYCFGSSVARPGVFKGSYRVMEGRGASCGIALSKLQDLKAGDEETLIVTVLSVSPLCESQRGVPYCSLTLAGYDGEARLVVFHQKAERVQSHVQRGDRIQVNVQVSLVDEHVVASPLQLQLRLPYKGFVKKIEGAFDGGGGRFHFHTLDGLLKLTEEGRPRVSDVVGVVLGVSGVDVKKRKKDQKEVILSKVTFGCVCMKKVVITLWEEQARLFAGAEGMLCAMKGVRFTQSDADGLIGDLGYDGSVYFQADIGLGKLINSEASVARFSEVSAWFESAAPTQDAFGVLSKVWVPPPPREMLLSKYQWELKQCKGTMETDFIDVLLSVHKVMVKDSLYYMACNKMRLGERGQTKMCKKELVPGGRCKKCGPVPDPIPLLRVRAAFVDAVLPSVGVDVVASSSRVKPRPIWLTAFGSQAESIFGITAEQCRAEGDAAILSRVRLVEQERKVHRCVLKGTSVDIGDGYVEQDTVLCAVRPFIPSTSATVCGGALPVSRGVGSLVGARAVALVADLVVAPAIVPAVASAAASAVTFAAGVSSPPPVDDPTEGVIDDIRGEGTVAALAAPVVMLAAEKSSPSPVEAPPEIMIDDARGDGTAAALAVAPVAASLPVAAPVATLAADGLPVRDAGESVVSVASGMASVSVSDGVTSGLSSSPPVTTPKKIVPGEARSQEKGPRGDGDDTAPPLEMSLGDARDDGTAAALAVALVAASLPAAAPVATLAADGLPVRDAGESVVSGASGMAPASVSDGVTSGLSSPPSVKSPKKIVTGEAWSQEKRTRGEDADTTAAGRRVVSPPVTTRTEIVVGEARILGKQPRGEDDDTALVGRRAVLGTTRPKTRLQTKVEAKRVSDKARALHAAALAVAPVAASLPAAASVATLAADGCPVRDAGESVVSVASGMAFASASGGVTSGLSLPPSVKTPNKIVTGAAQSPEKRARGEDADITAAGRRAVSPPVTNRKKIMVCEARSPEKRPRGEDGDTAHVGRRAVSRRTRPMTRSQTKAEAKRVSDKARVLHF